MKRISGAYLAIIGAALLGGAQAQVPAQEQAPARPQVKDISPHVVVEAGLEPLAQTVMRASGVPEDALMLRVFPAGAAGRAFCLSGRAFLLLAASPLPPVLAERCHAGPGAARKKGDASRGEMPQELQGRNRSVAAGTSGTMAAAGGKSSTKAPEESGEEQARKAKAPVIVQVQLAGEPLMAVQPKGSVPLSLDERTLYMALAEWIPQQGRIIRNPHAKWNSLRSTLPEERIRILLPENTQKVVRDFLRRACESGALPYWRAQRVAVDAETFRRQVAEKCASIRRDGAVRFLKEGDGAVIATLRRHRGALALVGRGAWLQHREELKVAPLEGDAPARPLFLAVDSRNLRQNPVAERVLRTFAQAVRQAGLLPPPPEEREALLSLIEKGKGTSRPDAAGELQERIMQRMPPQAAQALRGEMKSIIMRQQPLVPDMNVPKTRLQERRPVPRARGGVQVDPAPGPGANRVIDFNDLPPARNRRP